MKFTLDMKLYPIQIEYSILDMKLQNEYLPSPICMHTTPAQKLPYMVKRLPQALCIIIYIYHNTVRT